MILKNKLFKKAGTHALIFSSFKNEMSKSRIIDKVTSLMPLSREDAYDMVNRTPIIFVDEIEKAEGEKLYRYLTTDGCEMVLTEDNFIKRKCYRILWPEKPVFTFETAGQTVDKPVQEALAPKPAEQKEKAPTKEEKLPKKETAAESDDVRNTQKWEIEKKQLHNLLGDLQNENEALKKTLKEIQVVQLSSRDQEEALRSEIQNLKTELQVQKTNSVKVQEKRPADDLKGAGSGKTNLDKAQKEFTDYRVVTQRALEEMKQLNVQLQTENKALKAQLTGKEKATERFENDFYAAQKQIKEFQAEREKITGQLKDAEGRISQFSQKSSEAEAKLVFLQKERDKYREELTRLEASEKDARKKQVLQEERIRLLEQEKASSDQDHFAINNLREELNQVISEKNNFVDELKAKTELLELKEEEHVRVEQSLKEAVTRREAEYQRATERLKEREIELKRLQEEMAETQEGRDRHSLEISRIGAELAQAITDKTHLDRELNSKSELLLMKEEELLKIEESLKEITIKWEDMCRQYREQTQKMSILEKTVAIESSGLHELRMEYNKAQEGLETLQAQHKKTDEELVSLRSELRRTQETLTRVTREKTQQEEMFERSTAEKEALLEKQSAELRDVYSNGLETEKNLREKETILANLQRENVELKDYRERYTTIRNKYLEYKSEMDNRVNALEAELQTKATSLKEVQEMIRNRETSLEQLKTKHTALETAYLALRQDEEVNRQYREKFQNLEQEFHQVRESLQTDLVQTKRMLDETSRDLGSLRENHETLLTTYQILKQNYEEFDATTRQSLSDRAARIEELEKKLSSLEAQFEHAQRQLKEAHQQLAFQDIAEKRLRVTADINEQELKLKMLVEKQTNIEREIGDKADAIKAILKEQEEVEKDLVKNRQIQKHLNEQTKIKEKTNKPIRKFSNISVASPEQETTAS